MSQDMRRDHLIEKLAQFSPASGTIDRDAMLFAAGRASAPRQRGWKAAAGVLACSQAVMVTLWFSALRSPAPRPPSDSLLAANVPSRPASDVPGSQLSNDSYGNLMHQMEAGGLNQPRPIEDPVPTQPILSAALNSLTSSLE